MEGRAQGFQVKFNAGVHYAWCGVGISLQFRVMRGHQGSDTALQQVAEDGPRGRQRCQLPDAVAVLVKGGEVIGPKDVLLRDVKAGGIADGDQSLGGGLLGGFMMEGRLSGGIRQAFVLVLISFLIVHGR